MGLEASELGLVACWIEARPSLGSRIQWRRYEAALTKLIEHTGEPNLDSRLLSVLSRETDLPRILVSSFATPGHEVRFICPKVGLY